MGEMWARILKELLASKIIIHKIDFRSLKKLVAEVTVLLLHVKGCRMGHNFEWLFLSMRSSAASILRIINVAMLDVIGH